MTPKRRTKIWKCLSSCCIAITILWTLLWCSWILFSVILNDPSIGKDIDFQIHSWNDGREWPAALKKGANWWKLDLHYPFDNIAIKNISLCQIQLNIPSSYRNDTRGCLLFAHDLPVPTSNWYNTTYDLLSFIADPQYRSYFASKNGFRIALCAKLHLGNVCEDTEASRSFISLVDDFFKEANKTIFENNLNVTFILDGSITSGGKRDCLGDRWTNFASMYELYMDNPIALTTYVGDGKRLVISNQVVINRAPRLLIDVLALFYYGKFRQSIWPMINWEPDQQKVVLASASAYVNKGVSVRGGFRYAINLDPVHFQVSVGTLTKKAWNERTNLPSSPQKPLSVAFQDPLDRELIWMWILYSDSKNLFLSGKKSSRIYESLETYSTPIKLEYSLGGSLSNVVALSGIEKDYNNRFLWVVDSNSYFQLYSVFFSQNTSAVVKKEKEGALVLTNTSITSYSSRILHKSGTLFAFNLEKSEGNCTLQIRVWNMSGTPRALGFPLCITNATEILNATFDVAWLEGTNYCRGLNSTWASLVSFSDANNYVYYSSVCFGENGGRVTRKVSPSDVGEASAVSLIWKGSHIHCLTIQSNGFSYNEESRNKDPDLAICDQKPVSEKGMLIYSYGLLEEFDSNLDSNSTWITSCNSGILHGSFDMGSRSSASLFPVLNGNETHLAVAEVHEGLTSFDIIYRTKKYHGSGLPIPHSGLVVDSWPLPQLL